MIVENRCICFGLILKNQNGLVLRLTILMRAASALCLFQYFIAFLPPIHKIAMEVEYQNVCFEEGRYACSVAFLPGKLHPRTNCSSMCFPDLLNPSSIEC